MALGKPGAFLFFGLLPTFPAVNTLTIVEFPIYPMGVLVMRYLVWVLRLLVFVLVLLFALKNTEPVDVRFYADHVISGIPLIVVMLVVFALGLVFGLLVTAPAVMRRRREAARLRKEVARLQESMRRPVAAEAVAPETVAPLAPL